MNIYNSIIKAADRIERAPHLHSFAHPSVKWPDRAGRGCPLAQIAWAAGNPLNCVTASDVAVALLGVSEQEFFDRMDACEPRFRRLVRYLSGSWYERSWRASAATASVCLRVYATRFHSHEKSIVLPDWRVIAMSPLIPEHVRSEDAAHV